MPPLNYAFYTENFEIYQFHFKTYGHGVWYDETKETYDAAIDRAKAIMYDKVQKDNPHLIFFGGNPVRTETTNDFSENSIAEINNPLPEVIQNSKTFIQQIQEFEGTPEQFEETLGYLRTFPKYRTAIENKLQELNNLVI